MRPSLRVSRVAIQWQCPADGPEGKRKNLLKTKGIKVAAKEAPVLSKPTPAKGNGQMKMPKGKKLTEKRRQK